VPSTGDTAECRLFLPPFCRRNAWRQAIADKFYVPSSLGTSKRFSQNFLRTLEKFFLGSLEVKDIGLPAKGTTVFLGVFAPQRYIELLTALIAADRLCNREIPFHRR